MLIWGIWGIGQQNVPLFMSPPLTQLTPDHQLTSEWPPNQVAFIIQDPSESRSREKGRLRDKRRRTKLSFSFRSQVRAGGRRRGEVHVWIIPRKGRREDEGPMFVLVERELGDKVVWDKDRVPSRFSCPDLGLPDRHQNRGREWSMTGGSVQYVEQTLSQKSRLFTSILSKDGVEGPQEILSLFFS